MGLVTPDHLIPLLQRLQDAYGYLPKEVLTEVGRRTRIPESRMYGVATFYEQFHLEPRGKYTVRCCRGTACHVRNGHEVIQALAEELGIEEGQTTEDMLFTFETVACLGACALAPVVVIGDKYHGKMNPRKIKTVLKKIREADGAKEAD
ncbi:MAG: NADH-quinone oxidoreductase subunit NuoE [Phycisphaerae bacterium]|nr:NADH-quinone oxidoreductase subunit NuoE [Phycisphaerae bacterium]